MSVTAGPFGPEPPGRRLVVVAGIPGAGKSTLLARSAPDGSSGRGPAPVVLDSDPLRLRLRSVLPDRLTYRWYRPLVHLWHRLRIARAALGPTAVLLVHLPATWGYTRWWLRVLATLTRRRPHLVWVDVEPAQARRGQWARGRVVAGFGRHARRGSRFAEGLRAGRRPAGWTVTVVDRRPSAPAPGPVTPPTDSRPPDDPAPVPGADRVAVIK